MKVSEIKFGVVIINTACECYGRVVGFIEDHGQILVQVRSGKEDQIQSTVSWDPKLCRELTDREKGNAITAISQLIDLNLDREV